ncbi:unnamed protein product [Sphagnum jensenii]|uniref:Uncharacterized protein n=1 Tax=Sphagnum jensenii TaxID=128206 RepID=A0ABP1BDQ0_9BRYO
MGGGPMWRTAIRVVGSSSPSSAAVVPNAVLCRTGTTTPAIKSPASASISCTCNPVEVHRHHSAKQQPSSGSRQYWELEDWEFAAGGEEKDHLVFGTLPSRSEVEEATFELQDALRLGLVRAAAALPPEVEPSHSSSTFTAAADEKEIAIISSSDFGETQEIVGPVVESDRTDPALLSATADRSCCHHIGAQSAMLEAFHQFQHNPQVQSMVVSLATDKGVWDAVLANEKIQEFRRTLRTAGDGVSYEANGEGITSNDADDYINIFACFYWSTKKAFKQFVATLQDLIRGIFDATDKKVFAGEEGDFIERTIKSCMMLAMIVLSIVVFKRSAAQDTCHIRR